MTRRPVRVSKPRATTRRANDLRDYIRACEKLPNLNQWAGEGLKRARTELAWLDRQARLQADDRNLR